ncbi:hypothetical protein G6F40_013960 [Rhizopus arrhizus]|nr:hypothetical protein G6F40_013960 [Rhizopus arrhizus]
MTVPGALAVEFEQFRRQRAAQVQRRPAGTLGTGADQLRTPDPGHRLVHAGPAQRFAADQRILAAANGHQRMRLQAQHWRLHRFALHWQAETPAQVQAVAVGEFAQAVEIDRLHQRRGIGIDGVAVDADRLRHARLVVTDTSNQVQQLQRALHGSGTRLVQHERRAGHGDGFHHLRAVIEGVDQPGHAGIRSEFAADDAEAGNLVFVESSHGVSGQARARAMARGVSVGGCSARVLDIT